MALIPFPPAARITSMSLQQLYVGDVTHRSIYTGAQQTLARAPGRWQGTVDIAVTDSEADRRAVEAWLAAMRGTVNITALPLAGRDGTSTVDYGWGFNSPTTNAAFADALTGPRINDARAVNDDGSVWIPAIPSGTELDLPADGEYIRVGPRLYCVLESSAMIPWIMMTVGTLQPGIRAVPGVFPAVQTPTHRIVRRGLTVRAQLLDEAPVLPMDGDYAGPWTFNWIEQP